jgi:hypothetical protein
LNRVLSIACAYASATSDRIPRTSSSNATTRVCNPSPIQSFFCVKTPSKSACSSRRFHQSPGGLAMPRLAAFSCASRSANGALAGELPAWVCWSKRVRKLVPGFVAALRVLAVMPVRPT